MQVPTLISYNCLARLKKIFLKSHAPTWIKFDRRINETLGKNNRQTAGQIATIIVTDQE